MLWADFHDDHYWFNFVDNESAREAVVKGRSPVAESQVMIRRLNEIEVGHPKFPWYNRVPSASNPGDDPSRLKMDELRRAGALEDRLSRKVWEAMLV